MGMKKWMNELVNEWGLIPGSVMGKSPFWASCSYICKLGAVMPTSLWFTEIRRRESPRAALGSHRWSRNPRWILTIPKWELALEHECSFTWLQYGPMAHGCLPDSCPMVALALDQPPVLRAVWKSPAGLVADAKTHILEEGLSHLLRPRWYSGEACLRFLPQLAKFLWAESHVHKEGAGTQGSNSYSCSANRHLQ